MRRLLVASLLLAASFLVLAGSWSAMAQAAPADSAVSPLDRPGRPAVLPNGRKLNFRCSGKGSPTVILESGYGADSLAWTRTAPRIAQVTRVCAYDRAGYGFSDMGPLPRDGAAIARDLDRGLSAARIKGPYVLVGHSAGGLYMRLFAARRRGQVVGLVFVDSPVEHQADRLAVIFGPGAGSLDALVSRTTACLEAARSPSSEAANPACVPATGRAQQRLITTRPETWLTRQSELSTLFTSTSDQVDKVGDLLRRIPAIVLTATPDPDGVAAGPNAPGVAVWQAFHSKLASGFDHGQQRLVHSSHLMMVERPEVVADAVLELVGAARAR